MELPRPDFAEVVEVAADSLGEQLRRLDARVVAAKSTEDEHVVVGVADLNALLDYIREQDHRLCWFTTCKSCASLWDKNYEMYVAVAQLRDEAKKSIGWRQTRGMKPATDTSIFAATSLSGCIAIVRELDRVLHG